MTTMASQITSLAVVYSAVYSDADQRKHQSSASLAFVQGIHRDRWIPRTKGQLRGKCFHLMTSSWFSRRRSECLCDLGNSSVKTQNNGLLYCWPLLSYYACCIIFATKTTHFDSSQMTKICTVWSISIYHHKLHKLIRNDGFDHTQGCLYTEFLITWNWRWTILLNHLISSINHGSNIKICKYPRGENDVFLWRHSYLLMLR